MQCSLKQILHSRQPWTPDQRESSITNLNSIHAVVLVLRSKAVVPPAEVQNLKRDISQLIFAKVHTPCVHAAKQVNA